MIFFIYFWAEAGVLDNSLDLMFELEIFFNIGMFNLIVWNRYNNYYTIILLGFDI